MQKCEDTSAEQALRNQATRDSITDRSGIVALNTYTLDDGSSVRIDKQLAIDRVRSCINTTKKMHGLKSVGGNKENVMEVNFLP